MSALDPELIEAIWTAIKPLVPARVDTHPLRCHRRRLPDRDCFEVMVVRLATLQWFTHVRLLVAPLMTHWLWAFSTDASHPDS